MTIQWLIKNDGGEVVASGRCAARARHAYDSAARVAEAIERAILALADRHGFSQAPDGDTA